MPNIGETAFYEKWKSGNRMILLIIANYSRTRERYTKKWRELQRFCSIPKNQKCYYSNIIPKASENTDYGNLKNYNKRR